LPDDTNRCNRRRSPAASRTTYFSWRAIALLLVLGTRNTIAIANSAAMNY
jgi:hypothetical protein